MKTQEIIESIGAMASLSLGLPMGITAMALFAMFSVIITGESMFLFGWFFKNGYATLGLLASFIAILWFAGKILASDINKGKRRLRTTFRYSSLVNAVIWSTFLPIHFITNRGFDSYFGIEIPLTLAAISILFTPFTVGLWIHKAVAGKIKNAIAQQGA